jgi:DNA-directed RNA polymerase III subunit RPC4
MQIIVAENSTQEAPAPIIPSASTDRGRGRGRRGRGGEGRGAAPRPPPVEMTASGPFAMGPALAGTSAQRSAPRSNFAPIVPLGPGNAAALGAGLSGTAGPSLKREKALTADDPKEIKGEDDDDVYSDPDEGVDIIDMENVRQMDWMAPDSLRKEHKERKKKKTVHLKKEDPSSPSSLKNKGKLFLILLLCLILRLSEEAMDTGEVDLANALDLSESEEEEELEDLIDDFALQVEADQVITIHLDIVLTLILVIGRRRTTRASLLLPVP